MKSLRIFTFPRKNRLLNSNEYQKVFKTGKKKEGRHFIIWIAKNDRDYPRVGIVVSKQVSLKSVVRHRIKRIVRESFRQIKNSTNPQDIIVIAKRNLEAVSKAEVRKSLDAEWKKALI